MKNVELRTQRLLLRELRADDFAAVHSYASDREVVRFMEWGPNTKADTRAFLQKAEAMAAARPRSAFELGVIEIGSGALVGAAGLHVAESRDGQAMLGYCLGRNAWGRGIATEAGLAMLRFGFEDLNLHRVWAGCDPRNHGSRRVLEKLGMRQEGHLRQNVLVRSTWCDTLLFAILRSEWLIAMSGRTMFHPADG